MPNGMGFSMWDGHGAGKVPVAVGGRPDPVLDRFRPRVLGYASP